MKQIGSMDDKWMEGRFPANIILDEEAAEVLDEQSGISKGTDRIGNPKGKTFGGGKMGEEVIGKWFGDQGGASRYFKVVENENMNSRFLYVAKVSKKERNLGCEELEKGNNHATVKPIKLMMYLIKLITPPNGIVLDPFLGSGSTGVGAALAGFNFIGMEQDNEYFNIAESRIINYKEYEKIIK
jgi:site-specific DNA-methyltransferase (adenine-specific)